MNSHTTNTNAVSPVLAVILMIGVTVLLSTAIGILVLDLGQATTTQEPSNLGVSITEHEPGTVKINTKTGSTDSLQVLVNGEERINQSVTPGERIELTGVPEDARISIIDASGSSDQLVVSQKVSNGIKFATAPTDVASIHANMSKNNDEYIITNVYELQAMNQDLSADYVLGNDIHASSTQYWNDGKGFTPVGEYYNRFTGSLDGNGYVVDGLYINRSSTNYVGLIGYSDDSDVSNIGVVNADVSGNKQVGGLVGYNNGGTVTSSYSTGSVTGTGRYVGGLVGFNYNEGTVEDSYSTGSVDGTGSASVGGLVGENRGDSTVTSSYSTGSVNGTGTYIGGLVGRNIGDVKKSYSTGDLNGNSRVGGLVGYNNGDVTSSYSTGSVTSNGFHIGGLVGWNSGGTVTSSYSTGSVSSESGNNVGGLVGVNTGGGTVTSSYSTGSVTGDEDVGGLVGSNNNEGTVTSSYWDTDLSGLNSSEGGTPLNTNQMTGSSAEANMSGFDFSNTWSTGASDEYPNLAWESE